MHLHRPRCASSNRCRGGTRAFQAAASLRPVPLWPKCGGSLTGSGSPAETGSMDSGATNRRSAGVRTAPLMLACAGVVFAGWLGFVYSRPRYDTPCGAILGPGSGSFGCGRRGSTCGRHPLAGLTGLADVAWPRLVSSSVPPRCLPPPRCDNCCARRCARLLVRGPTSPPADRRRLIRSRCLARPGPPPGTWWEPRWQYNCWQRSHSY